MSISSGEPVAELQSPGAESISRHEMLRRVTLGGGLVLVGAKMLSDLRMGTAAARGLPLVESAGTDSGPVVQWNNAMLAAIRASLLGPPMVARALAIVHTCIYDAWAAYDPVAVGTRLGGSLRVPLRDRTEANKTEAISFAAYRALMDLFPSEAALFSFVLTGLGYNPTDSVIGTQTPSGIGTLAAQAVLDFRHGDGSNQLGDLHPGAYSDYTGYHPVNTPDLINDPNRWQPLRVPNGHGGFTVQRYTGPHWGLVTPFALSSGAQFRPALGPATFPTERYTLQAEQMLDYSANLTDVQKIIAEYFADGPNSELPPGHWCLFGQFCSQRDHHNLDADVTMFFALANAVFDAGIAAWDAKRVFDSVRPVTAIHYLFQGKKVRAWGGPYQGTKVINGEDWRPYQKATVVTPPFAEFVSGHSAFSAAGAEILKRFSGSDAFGASYTRKAGTSLFEPGPVPATDVTLAWATFSAAADEAGLSRRYGGIHFPDGDLVGRSMGRQVGAQVWDKAQTYINGTAGTGP